MTLTLPRKCPGKPEDETTSSENRPLKVCCHLEHRAAAVWRHDLGGGIPCGSTAGIGEQVMLNCGQKRTWGPLTIITPVCIMRRRRQNNAMGGGFDPSRKLTTLSATGGGKNKTSRGLTGDDDSGLKPANGGSETDGCRSLRSRVNLRNNVRVATWNVQTLYQAGKLANVIGEMRRGGIAIMGVAEARWTGSGSFTSESEELVIYSGADSHERGVAIILSREIKNSLMEYRAISDRIIYVRLRAAPVNISLYQIYAPTDAAEEEAKDRFYLQLEEEIEKTPKKTC